jgi:hypothetical protein
VLSAGHAVRLSQALPGAIRSSISRSKKWRSGGKVENSASKASRSTASRLTAVALRVVARAHVVAEQRDLAEALPGPSRRSDVSLAPGRA